MKGVKLRKPSSLSQVSEWDVDGLALDEGTISRSRNPSLHVSIQSTGEENPGLGTLGRSDEEHRQRLVDIGGKVGCLAHDIRNPLSSIEWFASLLGREQHSQEERQELAEHCVQAVRSLDRLVSNILIFSSPLQAARETVNFFTVCQEVEVLARYPLRKKRVTIHHHQEEPLASIRGEESLLKQGLLNLLVNAIHASEPDSTIEIHCRNASRHIDEEGKTSLKHGVVLRIRDFGCGMSEEELSNIFRPFYSRRKGGTGLGLPIVKHIVHLHHGVIDITSQQGKGTTVDLFFPQ
jgi:signal transduction histidine kinase